MKIRKPNGFTMVEVMIVVLIIAILCSIALPDYHRMRTLANRSEGVLLLGSIRIAESAYVLDFDTYAIGATANLKLEEVADIPKITELKFYTYNRSYVADDAKIGYCVRLMGNIDTDQVIDTLVLAYGPQPNCSIFGALFPEGITVVNDDVKL